MNLSISRERLRILSSPLLLLIAGGLCLGGDQPRAKSGLEKRVLWTTSKVVGTPEPPNPYRTQVAFPKLKFYEPLSFAAPQGSDRIFIAERPGKISSFVNKPDAAQADLCVDVGRTIYGIALHPNFAKNGYVYLTSVLDPANPSPNGSRLSRVTVTKMDPPTADKASEKVILEWPSGGHNGGCIKFGPDGHLYLNTGDGSGIADELQTGQRIDDLLASMLRIDVDHPAGDKAYSIPADNPFVNMPGARPEVFAYGLRQSWKFSFDPAGNLWAGEVGQDLWEMVHIIRKGGNYGWSIKEANHDFRPERPQGPSPIIPPIVEHNHTDFRSITGGAIYQGSRLKELQDRYIYADYDTGRIWALKYVNGEVADHRELADTADRWVEIGQDQAGEMYFVDFIGGQLHRLVTAPPPAAVANKFPQKLSETGLFASTKDHTPAAGLIPYEVNSQLWSDGATKERFLALPGDTKIEFDAIEYPQPAPGAPRGWRFPDGTVVVKTFSLEMEKGNPASARRLETRILHFEQTPGTQEVGDQVWYGYTYIWNDDQTDATLAPKNGVDREFTIKDASALGGSRQQTWHFPSRAECTLCHTQPAKFVLGVNTMQLNRDHDYRGTIANQLSTFEHLGLFKDPLPKPAAELPRLVDYEDGKAPLAERARAYLHSNCSHCHMKWGGGNAEFQLLSTLALGDLGVVNVKPAHGAFGVQGAKLLTPGDPKHSLIQHRMTLLGQGRMPHVGSKVIHDEGVKLITEWIAQLPQAK